MFVSVKVIDKDPIVFECAALDFAKGGEGFGLYLKEPEQFFAYPDLLESFGAWANTPKVASTEN